MTALRQTQGWRGCHERGMNRLALNGVRTAGELHRTPLSPLARASAPLDQPAVNVMRPLDPRGPKEPITVHRDTAGATGETVAGKGKPPRVDMRERKSGRRSGGQSCAVFFQVTKEEVGWGRGGETHGGDGVGGGINKPSARRCLGLELPARPPARLCLFFQPQTAHIAFYPETGSSPPALTNFAFSSTNCLGGCAGVMKRQRGPAGCLGSSFPACTTQTPLARWTPVQGKRFSLGWRDGAKLGARRGASDEAGWWCPQGPCR